MAQDINKVRMWRERNGVRLEDLADLAGLSTATLSRIERGLYLPNPLHAVRIAQIVGVRVGELFPGLRG